MTTATLPSFVLVARVTPPGTALTYSEYTSVKPTMASAAKDPGSATTCVIVGRLLADEPDLDDRILAREHWAFREAGALRELPECVVCVRDDVVLEAPDDRLALGSGRVISDSVHDRLRQS